jgi:two-component system chemotaxis response regulator CheY
MYRVLIADDNLFMRTVIRNHLERAGFEIVAEAANGREAVKLYRQYKPDIVFMDITMPEMTGIEAIVEIRKVFSGARIIVCSAMGQESMVIDAIKAGAVDFIVKPIYEDSLLERARKVCCGLNKGVSMKDVNEIVNQNRVDFEKMKLLAV